MKVMAQMAMVMNLDKCIGCHTCSVTCKQAWTNRSGTEYIWFNNVETRPGLGYPRTYEDQEKWQGGWELNSRGRLKLKAGGRFKKLLTIFSNPKLPSIGEYYEPWTYDYATLTDAPAQEHTPGGAAEVADLGQEHEDRVVGELGRRPRRLHRERAPRPDAEEDRGQGEVRVRADLHVLPAADLRALPEPLVRGVVPQRGDLQARGGRHRPGRPGPVPRLADVRLRLPLQEGLLQPPHRQGREVHLLLPADRGRPAHGVLRDLRRAAALHRPDALRRRQGARGGLDHRRPGTLRGPARRLPRPVRPRGDPRGREGRHRPRLGRRRPALPDLRPHQHLPGGAAAASGVPHHADGLVHPAPVSRRRRRGGDRRGRRGQGQPVRGDRRAADPGRVPRRAVHGRRRRAGRRRAQEARRDALLHARHQHGPRPGRARSRPRSG